MSGLALIAGLLGAVATWPAAPSDSSGDNARQVVREALVAVEHDSARAIMARWFGAPNAARVQARTLHDRTGEGEALPAVADARMDEDAKAGRAYLDSALKTLPAAATEPINWSVTRRLLCRLRRRAPERCGGRVQVAWS